MHYRSIADMNATLRQNAWRLEQPIDLVVGIPRSGLLAANMLSLLVNAPMADLDGYLAGRILAGGKRSKDQNVRELRRVVVIDDSVLTGSAMREARTRIDASGGSRPTYVAVFGEDSTHRNDDFVLEKVPPPRVFEWNLMHHPVLTHACLDIDGVLCADPTHEENDDGPAYCRFLEQVPPLCIPTVPVGQLVTSRLEKYRGQTEAWLHRWGVQYQALHMLNLPDAAARSRQGAHALFKAGVYSRSSAVLFIESHHSQALEIAKDASKPVLCMCCGQLVQPDSAQLQHALRTAGRSSVRRLKLRLRRVLGDEYYARLKEAALRSSALAGRSTAPRNDVP